MFDKFDKDLTAHGMLLGFFAPFTCFLVFYLIVFLIVMALSLKPFVSINSLALLSIAPNFLLVRRSLSRKKMEHHGRGVLLMTFVFIMLFFLGRQYLLSIHLPGLM